MPNIFKALASIVSWVLFLAGAIALVRGYVTMLANYAGKEIMPSGASPVEFVMGFGIICLALSVVVMVLRKKME